MGESQLSPLLPTFARIDLSFERGEGPWLITPQGDRYLDFAAGIAVNSLGHSHPHLVEALKAQGEKLWHISNLYHIPEGEKLAKRLTDNTFADTVFFTNSGAEAMECAIKMARKYHSANGHPERYRIITFEGAFHGRTLATIAAGGQAKYLEGFGPKVEGFDQVPFGDHKAIEAVIGPETAAILVEPVQGEGGVRPVPPQCLRGLRELCDKHGLLLIFDEVQAGVGRTGKFFAHQKAGVAPDIMAVAKGIGGGFPLGACLATTEAGKGMTAGVHGTTYGGNPLAMAVGNEAIDMILEPGFLDHVNKIAGYLHQQLGALTAAHPGVFESVRGQGLMIGLKMKTDAAAFIAAARANGLVVLPAGDNVVRLLPPLTLTEEEAREGLDLLNKTDSQIEAQKAAAQ